MSKKHAYQLIHVFFIGYVLILPFIIALVSVIFGNLIPIKNFSVYLASIIVWIIICWYVFEGGWVLEFPEAKENEIAIYIFIIGMLLISLLGPILTIYPAFTKWDPW